MTAHFHFQFLLTIIYKINLVTYHFYFIFGKVYALVNSSDNLAKSYSVENWICQKRSKSKYQIFRRIIFPQTSLFKGTCRVLLIQKISA